MIASGSQNQLQSSFAPLRDILKAFMFLSNLNLNGFNPFDDYLKQVGPLPVINPLPTPWLGLGGDGSFDCLSPTGVPVPFFDGWSFLPSFFLFNIFLVTTLEADVEDPSFCYYYLCATTDCLTNALCLPASISKKDEAN